MAMLSLRRQLSYQSLANLSLLALLGLGVLVVFQSSKSTLKHRRLLHLDPKSVQRKRSTDGVRFLALGSINAYSYNMANPKQSKPAYPYLLSPETPNFSEARDIGALYPALCLDSLLRRDYNYNVILVDYSYMFDTSMDDMELLVTRLRQRFPSALMIFIRIWFPRQFIYQQSSSSPSDAMSLREWLAHHRLAYLDDAKELLQRTSPDDWSFNDDETVLERFNRIVQQVGGHIWTFPPQSNVVDALLNFGHFFHDDFVHLSSQGHEYVADEIERLVSSMGPVTMASEEDTRSLSLELADQTSDQCLSWFGDSRKVKMKKQNLKPVRVDKWPNPGWALECKSKGCSFVVERERDNQIRQTVYLQFIATPDTKPYQVRVGDHDAIVIEPSQHVHQLIGMATKNPKEQVIVPVGFLDPGEKSAIISINPTYTGGKDKLLSVTGVLLSSVSMGPAVGASSQQ